MKAFLLKEKIVVSAGLAFALLCSSCVMRQKEVQETPRFVTVSGTGTVFVQPDIATANFAVVTTNALALEANRLNLEAVKKIKSDLISAGYGADSITTDLPTVSQIGAGRSSSSNRIEYRVSTPVHIIVRNVGNIGSVVDIATKAGATELVSVDFSVSDMDGVMREARTNAVKQAYESANLMVKTIGSELGGIISIEEQRESGNAAAEGNVGLGEAVSKATAASGKQRVCVKVVCTYEIQ